MSAPSWRDLIAVHPAADLFPMMSDSEIDELAKDIEANTLRSPLSIWRSLPGATWQLLDGRNRVAAMARLPDGDEMIKGAIGFANQCEAHVDPWAFVISANIRRRHLHPKERESLLIEAIARNPTKSDRQIGKEVGVNGKTVAAARRKGEDVGSIPHVSQRTDSAGRQQPAHKPPPSKEQQLRAMREQQAPMPQRVPASTPQPAARPQPSPSLKRDKAIGEVCDWLRADLRRGLDDLLLILRDEQPHIADLPLEKRIILARGYLQALGVTADDLRKAVL